VSKRLGAFEEMPRRRLNYHRLSGLGLMLASAVLVIAAICVGLHHWWPR